MLKLLLISKNLKEASKAINKVMKRKEGRLMINKVNKTIEENLAEVSKLVNSFVVISGIMLHTLAGLRDE